MSANACDYVDAVFRCLFAVAKDCGMGDLVEQIKGLEEVGARLLCAHAVDVILENDLSNAHRAGEDGEDITKATVPTWSAVDVREYGGTCGAKNTPGAKSRVTKKDEKRPSRGRR